MPGSFAYRLMRISRQQSHRNAIVRTYHSSTSWEQHPVRIYDLLPAQHRCVDTHCVLVAEYSLEYPSLSLSLYHAHPEIPVHDNTSPSLSFYQL